MDPVTPVGPEGSFHARTHRPRQALLIVLDASVALSWFFKDELDDFATRSADRLLQESALVPPIFPAEVANAFLFASRKQRLSESEMRTAFERMAELPIRVDSCEFALRDEIELAKRYNLTIYDSMYLALARRRRMPLLTRDAALRRAAIAEKLADDEDADYYNAQPD